MSSSTVTLLPGRVSQNAMTCSPKVPSGIPMTAASITALCSAIACSISAGKMDSDLSNDPDRLDEALTLLRAHGAIDHARADLDRYVSASRAVLDRLPGIPARESLRRLAQAVATRQI